MEWVGVLERNGVANLGECRCAELAAGRQAIKRSQKRCLLVWSGLPPASAYAKHRIACALEQAVLEAVSSTAVVGVIATDAVEFLAVALNGYCDALVLNDVVDEDAVHEYLGLGLKAKSCEAE